MSEAGRAAHAAPDPGTTPRPLPRLRRSAAPTWRWGSTPPRKPRYATDILWYLYHENVNVYLDGDGDWWVMFEARCRTSRDDLLCRIYEDRPHICRAFDNLTCDVNSTEGDAITFSEPRAVPGLAGGEAAPDLPQIARSTCPRRSPESRATAPSAPARPGREARRAREETRRERRQAPGGRDHGQHLRLGDPAARRRDARRASACPTSARSSRPTARRTDMAEYAKRRRGARPRGDHRRRRRGRPPAGHGGGPHPAARARGAGGEPRPEGPRLAALHRADARRHPRRHPGHRQGGGHERGASSPSPSWPAAGPSCARSSGPSARSRREKVRQDRLP